MADLYIVALDLDSELVPGKTKAALRALVDRPTTGAIPLTAEAVEAAIARRTARKAERKAAQA